MSEISVWSSIGALSIVLAALAIFLYAMKMMRPHLLYGPSRKNPRIIIESELQLGFRQKILLVKVDNQNMLLSSNQSSINLLCSWKD
jgi:flagellar biogenesis protein FliO